VRLYGTSAAARLVLWAVAVAVLAFSGGYSSSSSQEGKKERPAPQEKTSTVEYVCPMHADVKSKSRGTCPKCKMSLVKKRGPRSVATSPKL
jgi:hypothetical protein